MLVAVTRLLAVAVTMLVSVTTTACAPRVPPPPLQLTDSAPSIDVLLDRFTDAVARQDGEALHRLRLTRAEYIGIIVPGNVPPGRPPQQTFPENNQFFWSMLDTKSRYLAPVLFKDFGGREYIGREDVRFTEPPEQHDWYTAHGELRMTLRSQDGAKFFLRSGWIAEVAGQYKFIGFEWDD
jgi:hypothetical protein